MDEPAPSAASSRFTPEQQKRGMRSAMAAQCFGALGFLVFSGAPLMLLYCNRLGLSSTAILIYLSLNSIIQGLFMVPAAFFVDRVGLKRGGMPGLVLGTTGFTLSALAGTFDAPLCNILLAAGISTYAFGMALFTGCWFALMQGIVPPERRGRFFGLLRFTWQAVGLVFGWLCAFVLAEDSPLIVFQLLVGVVALGQGLRIPFVARIPEVKRERSAEPRETMLTALAEVIRAPGYSAFCCYVFLLTLFTAVVPNLFNLVELKHLDWNDASVAWMGNLLMIGAFVGFFIGGPGIDRLGTKAIFLIAHFAYGLLMFAYLLRDQVPFPAPQYIGALYFLFGVVQAGSATAISTEMLALMPRGRPALASALCVAMQMGGQALANLLSAWMLKLGFLRDEWNFMGQRMCSYDALVLLCAVMVVLLVVALGLVPSVIRKAETTWMQTDSHR